MPGTGLDGYMYTHELIAEFDTLLAGNEAIIEKLTLPFTSSGGPEVGETPKPIYYYKVGKGDATAPKILINAGIHAREWAPPDALLTFVRELINAYNANDGDGRPFHMPGFTMENADADDNDMDITGTLNYVGNVTFKDLNFPRDEVKRFIDELQIYIIPVSNPDGRDYSLQEKAHMAWRTNRRQLPGGDCTSGPPARVGVDLNRNFDAAFFMDEYFTNQGEKEASKHTTPYDETCSTDKARYLLAENDLRVKNTLFGLRYFAGRDVYQGPTPSSENETKNLKDLMDNLGITYYLDIHSYTRGILVPWGINSTQVYDDPDKTETFKNTNLNRSTGGGRVYNGKNDTGKYREYFPDHDGFELQRKHYLLVAHMNSTVFKKAEGDEHARNRSKYILMQSAALYPAVGGSSDYALSTCFKADASGDAEIIESQFPKFSLTLEAGHYSDGEFWPDKLRHQYSKVEREVHCIVRGLLAYAVNIERYQIVKTPK